MGRGKMRAGRGKVATNGVIMIQGRVSTLESHREREPMRVGGPDQFASQSRPRPFLVQSRQVFPMFSLFLILVLPLVHALQLHHRLIHPSSPPDEPFFKRASIHPDAAGNPRIESLPTLESDFEAFTRFETQHVTDALYQLALDPQSDSPWLISSVKAVCLSFPPLHACSPSFLFFLVPSRPHCQ